MHVVKYAIVLLRLLGAAVLAMWLASNFPNCLQFGDFPTQTMLHLIINQFFEPGGLGTEIITLCWKLKNPAKDGLDMVYNIGMCEIFQTSEYGLSISHSQFAPCCVFHQIATTLTEASFVS